MQRAPLGEAGLSSRMHCPVIYLFISSNNYGQYGISTIFLDACHAFFFCLLRERGWIPREELLKGSIN